MGKRLITQADVIQAAESGQKSIIAPPNQFIVTPGARDKAQSLGVAICDSTESNAGQACAASDPGVQSSSPASSPLNDSMIKQVCDILNSRLPAGTNKQHLEQIVRDVAAAKLGGGSGSGNGGGAAGKPSHGVCLVEGDRLMQSAEGKVPVDEKVLLADAIQCSEGFNMAGGYMQWEKASFRRTVEQSEISVVLEGELHLTVGGKTIIGRRGDMIFFPQGAKVIYSTPGKVRLACVNCIQ